MYFDRPRAKTAGTLALKHALTTGVWNIYSKVIP
jgi:hypothetical protein